MEQNGLPILVDVFQAGVIAGAESLSGQPQADGRTRDDNRAAQSTHKSLLQMLRIERRSKPARSAIYWPNIRKQPPKTSKNPAKMIKRLLQPQPGRAP